MQPKQQLEEHIRRHRRAVLLVNTASRRAGRFADRARSLLEDRGMAFDRVLEVSDGRQLGAVLAQALALEPALLIVGGGDGTLSRCAAALAYRHTVLGILPLGTTNNFARSMGIPLDLTAAVEVITTGKVADVDLGMANGRYFANVAGVGLSALVAGGTGPGMKRCLGRLAYMVTGLRILARHRPFSAWLDSESAVTPLTTHQLVIANGGFHGGSPIRGAGIDDRLLAVFGLGGRRRAGFLVELGLFVLGFHRPATGFLLINRLRIETERPVPVELDGELAGTTPLLVEVAAEALKIMVLPSFPDD
ncbi:diacylglycerol kinase family protein [Paenarthrobacter nicotinovorans]|uniref:diacylglycerol/lipid kinase family protein n=1 Tax=Paenarthrobacter nicotinovorans TaxID=29320 RepID=UPI00119E57CD|nr:YegS/Rv2252/BmrU family lipid kinase [Paenarthrobacter nicotinovorans]